jgi:hypothetical protein
VCKERFSATLLIVSLAESIRTKHICSAHAVGSLEKLSLLGEKIGLVMDVGSSIRFQKQKYGALS